MKIIYESNTGNTKMLAYHIKEKFKDVEIYDVTQNPNVDGEVFFLGSWCDKGSMGEKIKSYASKLHHKKVFVFGTCGFGKDKNYFQMIADRMTACVPSDNEIIGSFVCQGKINPNFQKKYEMMLLDDKTKKQAEMMLENFKLAESHPTQEDLNQLTEKLNLIKL